MVLVQTRRVVSRGQSTYITQALNSAITDLLLVKKGLNVEKDEIFFDNGNACGGSLDQETVIISIKGLTMPAGLSCQDLSREVAKGVSDALPGIRIACNVVRHTPGDGFFSVLKTK